MGFEWSKPIATYFDRAATAYARFVEPVFHPLAVSLVEAAQLQLDETVLDVGTGTGLVAEAASSYCRLACGIDFSTAMLAIAHQRILDSVVRADIHKMPLPSNRFDAALASFAYNSTDPTAAFAETYRILRPSGRLLMQEWAELDEISEMVSDLFAEYMVDDPPPDLERLRDQIQQPIPWDDLESIEALKETLKSTGFTRIEVQELTPAITLANADTFLRYKLAWPIRAAELNAMPDEIRALCLSDLHENIAPYTKRDTGQLVWQPNIVRISAVK